MSASGPGGKNAGKHAGKNAGMPDLALRLGSALVMIAAALAAAWYGGHAFTLFWLAAAVAINWEWQALCGGPRGFLRFALGGAALAAAAPLAMRGEPAYALLAIAAGAAGAAALASPGPRLWSAAGVVYAGALVVSLGALRGSLFHGFEAVLWLFAVVWATDIMAYFGGRLIGGPKLWPRVSPSKTWSGFGCGVLSGALCGLAVAPSTSNIPVVAGLSLAAAIVSQGGDLMESSVKRHFGVKDASALIPGHGGLMDRLDGFVAAALFAMLVSVGHVGWTSAATGLFHW